VPVENWSVMCVFFQHTRRLKIKTARHYIRAVHLFQMLFKTTNLAHRIRKFSLTLGTVAFARLPGSSTTTSPDVALTIARVVRRSNGN
jgi:hypothetical protein